MGFRRSSVLPAALVALTLAVAGCTGIDDTGASAKPGEAETSATSGSQKTAADPVTAIMVQPMQPAQVVRGSDLKDHIEYNLLVVNVFSDPVTLTGVSVVEASGDELMKIQGAKLAAATQSLYTHAPSAVVPASAAVAVEVDLVLPSGHVPERVSTRITYTLPAGVPGSVIVDDTVVKGPTVEVDRAQAITIKPRLAGDGWLATSACRSPNVHRDLRLAADGLRFATTETFAADWALVKGNRVYDGDGSRNEQFYDFGTDVLAVADSTVASTSDAVQEFTAFASTPPEAKEGFGGNTVLLTR